MYQKDYIMRMIEQLTKVIARVLFLKEEGKNGDAQQEIENGLATVGISQLLLDTLSAEAAAEVLGIKNDRSGAAMKCLLIGRLLKEKHALAYDNDPEMALHHLQKAYDFYRMGLESIGDTDVDTSSFRADALELRNRLFN